MILDDVSAADMLFLSYIGLKTEPASLRITLSMSKASTEYHFRVWFRGAGNAISEPICLEDLSLLTS